METADSATEGDPLKRGEDGAETGTAPSATGLKKKSCKEVLGFSKLTHWRTAVFFFSLFLCLTIVFAFSFIIPCPVRPQYLVSWNRTFPEAATYDFLAIEDTSEDKVNDVLFVIKSTEVSENKTCDAAALPSPCVFVSAVDGTDGTSLWEFPLEPDFHWAQCGLDKGEKRNLDCLLSHSDKLTAIGKHAEKPTAEIRWQQPRPSGLRSTVPVLIVPDLDGDKVADVALVASDSAHTQLVFISGKAGDQIGSPVVLDYTETISHFLHHTTEGHYVILHKDTGVYGLALQKIAAMANPGMEKSLKEDQNWEMNASEASGLVPIYESDSVKHVLTTGGTGDSPNLLLVTGTEVVLVDGKNLQPQWKFNTSSVISEPSFGHYNKDEILDIVLEEDIGNHTKRVVILDGKSGGILWEVNLLATLNSPRPASIHTTKSFSIFVFWGMFPSPNMTVPLTSDRHSYMLLPLYPEVLLQSNSSMDHIIAFKATLLERGRHAAYITLTGPETAGAEGTVVLSKRKLKQDVPTSTVLRIDGGKSSEKNDDIKEAFSRLRFSEW